MLQPRPAENSCRWIAGNRLDACLFTRFLSLLPAAPHASEAQKKIKKKSIRRAVVALYEFSSFILDVPERRLTRQGDRVVVAGKTIDVLRLLLEASAPSG
jgi:hypothetical protein